MDKIDVLLMHYDLDTLCQLLDINERTVIKILLEEEFLSEKDISALIGEEEWEEEYAD